MQVSAAEREPMAIKQSKRPVAGSRLAKAAQDLLDASSLCAIATVGPNGSAYVNTAYFAFSPRLDLIWMSEPHAQHSRNIQIQGTAAIAVYDSSQTWGKQDRGIQLFGSAREVAESEAGEAEAIYGSRFPEYEPGELRAYHFYAFRPCRMKLFDERELGGGRFVSARVEDGGRLAWESTEIYGLT
jgi:uncharacterized protein YhbP (UPF0306 family)